MQTTPAAEIEASPPRDPESYAKQNKMAHVLMGNREGHFVEPQDANFKAAAAGADWSRTFFQVLTDEPGKDAWPITGATFILMHKVQDKPGQANAALKFFDWACSHGDKMAAELNYGPMPASVKEAVHKQCRPSRRLTASS